MSKDPEAAFLASKQVTGNEWELYKENVRPLKRGRNVQLLNQALRSQQDHALKKSLLQTRRRMIQAIEEYKGEDPLQPWLEKAKPLEQLEAVYRTFLVRTTKKQGSVDDEPPNNHLPVRSFGTVLTTGEASKKAKPLEQLEAVYRTFLVRTTKKQGSVDDEPPNNHLPVRSFGTVLTTGEARRQPAENSDLMKGRKKLQRKAKPLEQLEAVYRTFLVRTTKKQGSVDDEPPNNHLPVRSFGTVLTTGEARRQPAENSDLMKGRKKLQRSKLMYFVIIIFIFLCFHRLDSNRPLSIYNDANSGASHHHNNVESKENSWDILGTRSDRNKENTSVPTKWVSYKIPQKMSTRTGLATSSTRIEVYIDEECADLPSVDVAKSPKPCVLKLRKATSRNLKKETELLKEDPLRNFPLNSLR
ncbi:mitotic spindle checkpoint protein BUBR1 [Cocos nucifera]|uniref:Mitotic spindle checkpoint protein BUBR1 n=1 Tax=Cocos nucifera TaxID=13894 RepID=A0A8K0HUL7_COCNU|nr:mitotic spindle checkpoint protein BUBR1 [Cocos nucifera]